MSSIQFDVSSSTETNMLEYHTREGQFTFQSMAIIVKKNPYIWKLLPQNTNLIVNAYELGSELTSATHKANDRKEGVREEEVIACVNWILNICVFGVCY